MGKSSFDEIDAIDGTGHDFAKAFNLALSLKIDNDPRLVCAPFVQAFDKMRAFCFGQHEIAGRELSHIAILKRAAEILRTSFNPAFADLNVCARNALGSADALACCFWRLAKKLAVDSRVACQCGRGARAPQGIRLFIRLDDDDQIVVTNVITNKAALVFRCSNQKID